MLDLLCIGEAMAELRQGPEQSGFVVGFAGDTYNTAVYAKRCLGTAGAVGFMSRLGCDPLSDGMLAAAQAEGLETGAIARDEQRNIGIYSVSTDASGERSFHYWRSQSAARELGAAELAPARILYLSGITLAILSPERRRALVEALGGLKGSCEIAFDSNYRPRLWESQAAAQATVERMWDLADLAFPSIDDEMALFGDASEAAVIKRFERGEFASCTIKRGDRGPLSLTHTGSLPNFPKAAKVVDTTAAGDSFNGGFLASRVQGKSEAECLLAGHELAVTVVGQPGAIMPIETRPAGAYAGHP